MTASGGWRVEWRFRLRQLQGCRGLWVPVALLLAVQWIVVLTGGDADGRVFQWFGLSRDGILSGHLWGLVTHALLHGNWLHLSLNVMLFMMLGSRLEHICGWPTMLRVAGLGILFGGIGHLATSQQWLVGASGAVMALVFCYCGLSPESRVLVPLRVSAKSLARGLLIAELVLMLLDPNLGVPGASRLGGMLVDAGLGSVFGISHACHLGGALAGWAYARWLLRPRASRESLQRDRERREGRSG